MQKYMYINDHSTYMKLHHLKKEIHQYYSECQKIEKDNNGKLDLLYAIVVFV